MTNPYNKQIGGSHYQKFRIQPSTLVIENELLYPEGCAIKYNLRHRLTGKKQDLEKAINSIEMIIERDYKDFLEEAEKEKKELEESYKESKRQAEERKSKNSWGIVKNVRSTD